MESVARVLAKSPEWPDDYPELRRYLDSRTRAANEEPERRTNLAVQQTERLGGGLECSVPLLPRGFSHPYAAVGVFVLLWMIWLFVRRLLGYKPRPAKKPHSKPWKRDPQ